MPITPRSGVNAATMAANWSKGVSGSSQKWLAGYLSPRRVFNSDPQGAQAGWVNGVNDAISRGAYAAGLAAVDLNQTATNATNFGAARFAQAGTSKAQKFTNKTPALAAAQGAVNQSIASLPRVTLEDRIARSAAQQRGMAAYRGKI